MKLKFEFPQEISNLIKNEVIYSLPFDLTFEGNTEEGYLIVSRTNLYIFKHKELINQYELNSIKDFKVKSFVGSGLFMANINGEDIMLCGFKPRWLKRYTEVAKLLEYYAKTKIHSTYEEEMEEYVCSKCDTPFLNGSKTCFNCQSKGSVLGKIANIALPYKKTFIYSLIFTLFVEVLLIINPYILRIIIDDYIVPKDKNVVNLTTLLIVYFLVFTIVVIVQHFIMKLTNNISNNISSDLRSKVFTKIQELTLSSVSERTPGELMKCINSDTEKIQNFIANYGKDAISRIFSLIVVTIILFIMDYKMAILVFLPIPLVIIIIKKIQRVLGFKYIKQWRKEGRATSVLHDILSGIRVVKSYGNEKIEVKKYTEVSDQARDAMMSAETMWAKLHPYIGYIIGFGEFFVLWIGGKYVIDKQMELGELIQYMTYITMVYVPLRWYIQLPKVLADVLISAGKVFELLEEESEMKNIENPIENEIRGDVEFKNVSFGYKSYEPTLKNVSFNVKSGEMIGIVGHSGAGKSTLINLLMRLYDVTEGEIKIDDIDIKNYATQSLRSQVGVVLQETFLFKGTIFDNICYAKSGATFDEVIEASKIANAHEFIVKLPDAYHTLIGERGYTLSGGERQRIAIARAVLHAPKILILDEATSALDTETEKKIQEALERLTKGKTTFAIAHRLSTLQKANRILVLDKGMFAEFGTHDELLKQKGIYYNLVMAQKQTNSMKK